MKAVGAFWVYTSRLEDGCGVSQQHTARKETHLWDVLCCCSVQRAVTVTVRKRLLIM